MVKIKSSKSSGLPLIKNFFATTYFKAFVLNAISVAIIAALSIEMRSYLDRIGVKAKGGWDLSDPTKTAIVFVSGFTIAMMVYLLLYVFVGFGGGMLTDEVF
tara:strand:- start:701 stop:1006 length:306 start_codon:yes stop_codon:yes gene_type:complete